MIMALRGYGSAMEARRGALVVGNPCARVTLPRTVKAQDDDEDDARYLTPGDVDSLAVALPEPYGLLVRLAAYTGLRAGEIAGLQLRDIDLTEGTLRVRRQVIDAVGDCGTTPRSGRSPVVRCR
jgi:integrase